MAAAARMPHKKLAITLAHKLARIAWSVFAWGTLRGPRASCAYPPDRHLGEQRLIETKRRSKSELIFKLIC